MKILKLSAILWMFLFCIAPYTIHAQNAPYSNGVNLRQSHSPNVALEVSYDLKIETYYMLPTRINIDSVYPFDKLKMIPRLQKERHREVINDKGQMAHEIWYLEDNRLPDWMTKIDKALLTDENLINYDKNGTIISSRPVPEEMKATVKQAADDRVKAKFEIQPVFKIFSDDELQSFVRAGYEVKKTASGFVLAFDKDNQVIYDIDKLCITQVTKDESKNQHVVESYFKRNAQGRIEPVKEVEKTDEKLIKGQIAKRAVIKTYSNYKSVKNEKYDEVFSLSVSPNPVKNSVSLSMNSENAYKNVSVFIFDVLGKQLRQETIGLLKGVNCINFDVNNLPTGMCFLVIKSGDKTLASSKFFKQ